MSEEKLTTKELKSMQYCIDHCKHLGAKMDYEELIVWADKALAILRKQNEANR